MPDPASATVSVLIPARNEADNLAFLIDEISRALTGREHEIVVVDDGSTDHTGTLLADKRAQGLKVRHIRHARPLGQSASVRTGVFHARGDILVTIDGDGQNDPAYIPELLAALAKAPADVAMAMGQRHRRTDGVAKRLASRFANAVRRAILRDDNADSGCGLKAVRREVFIRLPFFDGWHRFMPALIAREGYRVVRVDVIDRPRRYGKSNYGILDRGLRGAIDLAGVRWLMLRFRGTAETTEIGGEP